MCAVLELHTRTIPEGQRIIFDRTRSEKLETA